MEDNKELYTEFDTGFKNSFTKKPYTIARIDYESLPAAMQACVFTDEQMNKLAKHIGDTMCAIKAYRYDNPMRIDEKFWEIMEEEAVGMGMCYYEDLETCV